MGLEVSYLMDRYTVNTAKSQIGFMDFIVGPTFDVMKNYLPKISEYNHHMKNNKKAWEEKIEHYEA